MLWFFLSLLTLGVILLVGMAALILLAILNPGPDPEALRAEIEARAAGRRLHMIARTGLEEMLATARAASHRWPR